jgi:ansamitocin polyketide synthase C
VIKMVEALRHGVLPPTLHVREPSREVDWSAGAVELLTEAREWPRNGHPRRAGISSFGISGTNAHLIIEEVPAEPVDTAARARPDGVVPLVVSARNTVSLAGQAGRLADFIEQAGADVPLAEVAGALVSGRAVLDKRGVVVAADRDEAIAGLREIATGQGVVGAGILDGGVVFVFPGQGSQWPGMGARLLVESEVFAESMGRCAEAMRPWVDWSLTEAVRDGGELLARVDVVQPVSFAVMVSLAALWRSYGVEPDAVVGHSQGEIAAAHVCGGLSLSDAARVVVLRSQSIARGLRGTGGMMSVSSPLALVRELVRDTGLSVAAMNGPMSVVVTGPSVALTDLAQRCAQRAIRTRRIPVDYASHSERVQDIRDELLAALESLRPRDGAIPLYSTVTDRWQPTGELDGEYWFRNLREPVRFEQATRRLLADGYRTFVEVSPHPVLTTAIQELAGPDTEVTGTVRRDDGGLDRFLTSAAHLHTRGVAVDWTPAFHDAGVATTDLPTYPFQRERYWLDEAAAPDRLSVTEIDGPFWSAATRSDAGELSDTLELSEPDQRDALRTVLPALSSWYTARRTQATVDSWRYRISWKTLPDQREVRLSGTWLLIESTVGDSGDAIGRAIGDALVEAGARVQRVTVRDEDKTRDVLAARLRAVHTEHGDVDGLISLLALGDNPHPVHPTLTIGQTGLLALIQALGDCASTAPLWCVTRAAVSVTNGDAPVNPAQASLWGLGRVAALEHPGRWGGLIDVPASVSPTILGRLVAVLAGDDGEDQVAIRAAGVFARRLVHADPTTGRRTWTPRGTVLVTGGTGGVAAHVARWLAANGADHLVLTSRRGPSAEGVDELVKDLAGLGAEVTVRACDLADRDAVAHLLAHLPGEPLTAVVHAAGVATPAALADSSVEEFAGVLAGKATGAAHLDELLGDRSLDAFVLFSSNAAAWGSGTQGAYAAANAFLDGLAERRRANGLPATSIAWGAWDGGGMSTFSPEIEAQLAQSGLALMDPDLAVHALARAAVSAEASAIVTDTRWETFGPRFTALRPSPLFADLPELRRVVTPIGTEVDAEAEARAPELVSRLAGLTPAERSRLLVELVRNEAAVVLGHSSPDTVTPDQAFKEIGFDSLTAVELRNRITSVSGVRLAATVIFDHPTPVALAEHLLAELGAFDTGPTAFAGWEELATTLPAAAEDPRLRFEVSARLRALTSRWNSLIEDTSGDELDIGDASDDELFQLVDSQLGEQRQ